ncbi:MAG TPA: sulfotransferase [Rhodanobacteraceae bacterium]|nr:sulfotransferase [Rhodanobacteraceae bacterium]
MSDIEIKSIISAVRLGELNRAERMCARLLRSRPDDTDVLQLLGGVLQRRGKLVEALNPYARLVVLHPGDSLHWGNYATASRMAGDLELAERAAATAVKLRPDDPQRLDQLGMLQLQRGKPLAARDTLLRAFGKAPGSPPIRIDAARACVACHDYRADDLLRPWRNWLPLEDGLQFELAELHLQLGEAVVAQEVLEDLLQRAPTNLRACLLLASVYERINRLDDSEALLNRICSNISALSQELSTDVDHQRAQLAFRRRRYDRARELLQQSGPRDGRDYRHWFSLAAACDKLGDASATMHALESAHVWQIEELKVATPHCFEPNVDILPRANARVSRDQFLEWPDLTAPEASQSPVFVVGFPRSGTTLLEQMLDAHPRLQSMDERPFFNILANQLDDIGVEVPQDLYKLSQRDCDELRKGYLTMACAKIPRRWDAQLVDKNPLNMLWLPMIYRMFPRAKFILVLRHPCDVILSCYMQNFRSATLAAASQSLERLARAYIAAMESWLHHVRVFKPDVFVSRHEELVVDALGHVSRIAQFLGLDDAESMLKFNARALKKGFIKTPSYTQVIEPINARGVGRWLRYREYFNEALPIVRPMIKRWSYDE